MRRLAACSVALACLFGAARASAQELVPPHLEVEEKAAYPRGAEGETTVLLDVVVDEKGEVEEVDVASGEEPFASAAAAAARRSRFVPASRAGVPIRARIRIATRFVPPAPSAPEAKPPVVVRAPPPVAPIVPPSAIEEVIVTGRRDDPRTPTEHRMGRAEMRVVPGAFGDPFRAIDVLPGLVPIVSGLPYFYVRGAPPSAVGYYVDEVRVPYLFHFGLGPGVIQPAIVEEVALHPAAFPGRYGRFSGAIVSGTTSAPATELRGEGQIRFFDAGAYVEAPFAGGRGAAGVGGRYSYTAAVLSLLAPDVTIDYRDYNARVSYDLGDRWKASAFTFGAFDYASDMDEGREEVLFASEFHRLDMRLDRRGADGSTSRIATTLGIDRTRLEGARFAQDLLVGVRGRHRWPVSRVVDVELGADVLAERYSGDLPSPYAVSRSQYREAEALFAPRFDTASGTWLEAGYRPAPGWQLTGTLRADVFTSAGKAAVGPSPRASMRVPLAEKVAFLGALGVAPQPPAFAIPIPAVGYRGLPGGLSFGYQKSAGVEVLLPWKFKLTTVGFHHSYFALRDFAQDRGNVDLEEPQVEPSSPTQALGLEVLLMRKLSERFSAFGSATLSRAELGSTRLSRRRISPFDRTWVAQIGGVADLGRNWRASSRFLTYAGWPGANAGDPRLPAFFRVDARIEKRWLFGERRYIAFVIEGLNVTGSKEIVGRSCNDTGCDNDEFGPLIAPSMGVEGAL